MVGRASVFLLGSILGGVGKASSLVGPSLGCAARNYVPVQFPLSCWGGVRVVLRLQTWDFFPSVQSGLVLVCNEMHHAGLMEHFPHRSGERIVCGRAGG